MTYGKWGRAGALPGGLTQAISARVRKGTKRGHPRIAYTLLKYFGSVRGLEFFRIFYHASMFYPFAHDGRVLLGGHRWHGHQVLQLRGTVVIVFDKPAQVS